MATSVCPEASATEAMRRRDATSARWPPPPAQAPRDTSSRAPSDARARRVVRGAILTSEARAERDDRRPHQDDEQARHDEEDQGHRHERRQPRRLVLEAEHALLPRFRGEDAQGLGQRRAETEGLP